MTPHMCNVCCVNDHMYCHNMKRIARELPNFSTGCIHYIPCEHFRQSAGIYQEPRGSNSMSLHWTNQHTESSHRYELPIAVAEQWSQLFRRCKILLSSLTARLNVNVINPLSTMRKFVCHFLCILVMLIWKKAFGVTLLICCVGSSFDLCCLVLLY